MITEEREYATYSSIPSESYKIIEHLITNPKAEIIWKLLKYNDADAYTRPNLTQKEKAALIYKGETIQADYRVFFDFMMDDAETEMNTILRIYPAEV